jgi:hypothetical protein
MRLLTSEMLTVAGAQGIRNLVKGTTEEAWVCGFETE